MKTWNEQRRRLLTRVGQGMAWLSAASLLGCGGGGGGTSTGDLGGDGAPGAGMAGAAIGTAQRLDALASVLDAVRTSAGGGARFDSTAVARALQGLSAFERVGISAAVGNVWARFTDGLMLVVPNNLEPDTATGAHRLDARGARQEAPARRRALAASDGFDTPALLTARQYRQLDMLGQVPVGGSPDAAHLCLDFVDGNTLPQLRRMAVGRGFTLPSIQQTEPVDVGIDNGVPGLTDLSGDGVFFITACAAQAGNDEQPRTLICTATLANEAALARYDAQIRGGLLTMAVAMRGVDGAWVPQACLAIGPEWVSAGGWRFPVESIGIFNLTGAPTLVDWLEPLNRAGLRHILGWQRPPSWQRMLAFGDDLIQFNLATNNFDGQHLRQAPEPRLRSYGMGETVGYLVDRGVAGPGGHGDLFYLQEPTPALYVNTLLPTIDRVLFREGRLEFELVGQFGGRADTDEQAACVVVARAEGPGFDEPLLSRAADGPLHTGERLRDPLWQGGVLQTVLDIDPLDRGGHVQVWNGGRCSNVVPVTHWEIPIRAVTTIDTLTLALTVTVRLRADVHPWRLAPADQPRGGAYRDAIEGSVHSRADFVASGTLVHDVPETRTRTTLTWSGQGGVGNDPGQFRVTFGAMIDWDRRVLSPVSMAVAGGATYRQTRVVEQFDVNGQLQRRTEETTDLPVALAVAGVGTQGPVEMRLDERWVVLPGQFDLPPENVDLLPSPPQRVRLTRVNWATVPPDFPPRADYGGS